MKFKHLDKLLFVLILIIVGFSAGINIIQELQADETKIPLDLEQNGTFSKWLTNIKNKEFGLIENGEEMSADSFTKVSESNIFNTIWTSTTSIDNDEARNEYEKNMELLKSYKTSAESPNEREIVNYDPSIRFGFNPNEVFFYGLREDRILKTKVVDCDVYSNCYFDRAGFLDNHVFFVSEVSLKGFSKENEATCDPTTMCEYTFKIHLVDLMNNQRTEYESKPFKGVFEDIKKEL
jgi:hypothetical protein